MGSKVTSERLLSKLEIVICPANEVILSLIFNCNPVPVATDIKIITIESTTAAIAIFIIGAETLFL